MFALVKSRVFLVSLEKSESDGERGQGGWGRPKLKTLPGNICTPIVVNQCTVQ